MAGKKHSHFSLSIVGVSIGILIALSIPFTQVSGHESGQGLPILITQTVDESKLVTLRGNTRPEANSKNDRGPVPDDFPMNGMLLQLKRAPQLEHEFEQYIETLTDKSSPNFRHWMLAAEQGEKYGVAQEDLDTITGWLESHGFVVSGVTPNRMVIDFSGTAGQIREAFHTEIHYLEVRGEQHFANMSDPRIPRALAPAMVGVVSMHNFKPQPMYKPAPDYTYAGCTNTSAFPTLPGTNCYSLVPADFQTIYNINPLLRLGIDGRGQTITIVEDSNTFGTDVATYRSTFLSKYTLGSVTTTHPTGTSTCTNPTTNADDIESDLDAEIASAIAPNASIVMATCADISPTNGVLFAVQNLVNSATPPAIISMSYGECEAVNGAASNAAYNTAFQTGVTAGTSIFVSSGDAGAGGCAPLFFSGASTWDYAGIGVTGWGESQYNVSVGGTDFEDVYNSKKATPTIPLTTYWNSTNTGTDGSAKSYIPEIPWNNSCASVLIANVASGSFTTYGSSGFCNSTIATTSNDYLTTGAASGGPSACATGGGDANQTGAAEVDGTCAGYPKPSYQSGIFGNPADGVRDIPDVSLFASSGIWGHFATICYSDTSHGGVACTGAPSTWIGVGGTSVAAPAMASIQALVNEKWSLTKVGNPNPTYYSIAKSEFGASGNSACYSINQPPRHGLGTSCAFYDITQGDIDVNCQYNTAAHSVGCYRPTGTNGVLSTQALQTATVITPGSGYTGTPTCAFGAPSDLNTYLSPTNVSLWGGGTQATCTPVKSGSTIGSITINNAGQGYAGGTSCTISGGNGSGATCSASPTVATAAPAYQPAYGATPGWDFATGIGSVNAYNLVFNSAW
jgi:subtilase family serine protease